MADAIPDSPAAPMIRAVMLLQASPMFQFADHVILQKPGEGEAHYSSSEKRAVFYTPVFGDAGFPVIVLTLEDADARTYAATVFGRTELISHETGLDSVALMDAVNNIILQQKKKAH